jgi:hypothetical protein
LRKSIEGKQKGDDNKYIFHIFFQKYEKYTELLIHTHVK